MLISSFPTRRRFLTGAAAVAAAAVGLSTATATAAPAENPADDPAAPVPPPLPALPRYTLSVNLEMMFPRTMPFDERLLIAAKEGAKAYSFWAWAGKDLGKLREISDRYGMKCASITGANKTGWNTGLTKTGAEQAFLDDFGEAIRAAQIVGAENLITFVGAEQKDIPWDIQHAQIVSGLKKAGDMAEKANVYLTLEPLNAVESPQMALTTTVRTYEITAAVNHPRVKVDFDLYHRQLGEGNLLNTLRAGIKAGHVRFVEVGDVPGRFEPGTGEVDYARVFRVLHELGYAGYIGMEHRASTTPQAAFEAVRRLAGVSS